jgi:NAD-reducing hydrogenase small subunit
VTKKKIATVWLDGCSGCHMSLLDIDERLIELSAYFDLVYSPLVDYKIFPEDVDVALVEGSISTDEDEHKIRMIRERTKVLVSLGDCAVTGNVPSMRNTLSVDAILKRAYEETVTEHRPSPGNGLPKLLPRVRPVHELVPVDIFVPGCPPSANKIYELLRELLVPASAPADAASAGAQPAPATAPKPSQATETRPAGA